jgi:hypothetical protein
MAQRPNSDFGEDAAKKVATTIDRQIKRARRVNRRLSVPARRGGESRRAG